MGETTFKESHDSWAFRLAHDTQNKKIETGKWKIGLETGSLACHSERSEESPQFGDLTTVSFFASLRMTELAKRSYQHD